jgi:N1-acetylpolyamine oxidase
MNRRRLTQSVKGLATMAGFGQDNARHYDTIIIGAGMSGLACAAKLSEHPSYQNGKRLLVLEARDRIGGRIGSVHVNGNRLDTGANWIHGVGTKDDPNPLVSILPNKDFKELSCLVGFRPPPANGNHLGEGIIETQTDDDWVRVDSSRSASHSQKQKGDLVMPPKISLKLFGSLWTLIGSLHEAALRTSARDGKGTSILQTIAKDKQYRSAFDKLPKEYHQALRALPQFIEAMEAGPLDAHSAEHAADRLGMSLLEYALDDFDGEQVFLRDGYTAVVEELGKKVIEQGHVRLGVEVQHVEWDANPIVVCTSDGSCTAKRVICTLPLGVLQYHARSFVTADIVPFFIPELPRDKSEAITRLGFGTLDKIFLVYNQPWWTEEPYLSILKKGFVRSPMPGDPDESSTTDPKGPSEPDSMWGFTDELPGVEIDSDGQAHSGVRALSVMNLNALTGFPILSAFVSCANAVHVEGLSDTAASLIVHRSLTKWLGREPPMPDAVHVTRWAQDEYSRGSYSHMITGLSEIRHREALGEAIVNGHGAELRFAGEHTSINHFATVHGALLSGWREAEALLKSEAESDV